MQRILMKSKIHQATVTEANLHYEGSITLDAQLMRAADLLPWERVQVLDLNNGARFETYCVAGPAGSGTVCINGAAARFVQVGDSIIILSYAVVEEAQARAIVPKVVHVDQNNRIRQGAFIQ